MSRVIHVDDLQDGYLTIVNTVIEDGRKVSPRGMRTLELPSVTICLSNPLRAIPVGVGRKLNVRIGAAEAAQLIAGVSHAKMLTAITPTFGKFVEFDRLFGAYGPRTYPQFPTTLQLLTEDPDTRQAGAAIYRPDDVHISTRDVPCTLNLWYEVRNGALDCFVTMRSNDAIWGLTYDAWMFTALQAALAYALGIPIGTYTHHAISLHIYVDRDQEILSRLHAYDGEDHPPYPFTPPAKDINVASHVRQARWKYVRNVMEGVVGVRDVAPAHTRIAGPSWYRDVLTDVTFRDTHKMCPTCRYVLPNRYFYTGKRICCKWCDRDIRTKVPVGTYYRMMIAQRGCCAICGTNDEELWLDHDHATGIARGLLCDSCNKALGFLRDKPERAIRAANYLETDVSSNAWATDFSFLYRARPRDIGPSPRETRKVKCPGCTLTTFPGPMHTHRAVSGH